MSVLNALIIAGGTACFMLFFIAVMMPKEQKSVASRVILVHAVLVFLILICFGGGIQITKNPTSLALGSASENHQVVEKVVVEKPAPFVDESAVKEDIKSSESVDKKKLDSSVFDLVDRNIDGYFADGTPYVNYEIESGDTVFSICQDFDLEMAELKARNNLEDVEHPVIYAGAFLKVTLPE